MYLWLLAWRDRLVGALHPEAGQSTAEYALVICAAAAIVGLLITWVSSSNPITDIFGRVVGWVTEFIG